MLRPALRYTETENINHTRCPPNVYGTARSNASPNAPNARYRRMLPWLLSTNRGGIVRHPDVPT